MNKIISNFVQNGNETNYLNGLSLRVDESLSSSSESTIFLQTEVEQCSNKRNNIMTTTTASNSQPKTTNSAKCSKTEHTLNKGLHSHSEHMQLSRFADYFVICGLDLDTGLEPDRFAGKTIQIYTNYS